VTNEQLIATRPLTVVTQQARAEKIPENTGSCRRVLISAKGSRRWCGAFQNSEVSDLVLVSSQKRL